MKPASPEQQADRERDYRKHETTNNSIGVQIRKLYAEYCEAKYDINEEPLTLQEWLEIELSL